MSRMSKEDFDRVTFQQYDTKPDLEAKENSSFRRFWFLSVPFGGFLGVVAAFATGAPAAFWVVWVLATVVIQGLVEPK